MYSKPVNITAWLQKNFSMMKSAVKRLIRAYPSLNLKINVTSTRAEVDIVLPGLRFDDIDHTGQPDIWRVFDMINRVENAAFFNNNSFLDYNTLHKHNSSTFVKACTLDIKSDFYETITPKAPLDISIKLGHIGNSTFTTLSEMSCGGKMKPSFKIKNMHTLIDLNEKKTVELPEWWKNRFITDELRKAPRPLNIMAGVKPDVTFLHSFAVPLSDTDISENTRCSSYLRYFMENASIASSKGHYKNIKTTFHEFHVKRMSMLYFGSSCWGDSLISETWECDDPLILHCSIRKSDSQVWYGKMEMYSEVYGMGFI